MSDKNWWVQLESDDVARGPYDEEKLLRWIRSGRLHDRARVSIDGSTWLPAKVGLKHLYDAVANERRLELERRQEEKRKAESAAAARDQRLRQVQERAAREREDRAAAAFEQAQNSQAEQAARDRLEGFRFPRYRRPSTISASVELSSWLTRGAALVVALLGGLVFLEGAWGLGNLIANMATNIPESPGEEIGMSLGFAFAYPVLIAKICGGAVMVLFSCWAWNYVETASQQARLLSR